MPPQPTPESRAEIAQKSVLRGEVREGAYHDSIVLMELQVALSDLAGVVDAGVVMGTRSNLELLRQNGLLSEEAGSAREEDLVIAIRAADREAAEQALAAVDRLLVRRRAEDLSEYRPRSLEAALRQLPEARWVLVSVPGRYAADVARQALRLERSVFLYSDNVSLEDEAELKAEAASRGLLVLGPDCGTSRIGGTGFGFANRVRSGSIGLVGPSGTGLQAVSSRIHEGGGGISQMVGTGGRDLASEIGGATTVRALELLGAHPSTEAIVLVSKPPDPKVAGAVLDAARATEKPVVVYFQGLCSPHDSPVGARDRVLFARSLSEAAELALRGGSRSVPEAERVEPSDGGVSDLGGRHLRGLFSGGTLALEMLLFLRHDLPLSSNLALEGVARTSGTAAVSGHAVLDLGADELTVGRLHPMIDFDLRLRRLEHEAADPEVGLVFLDVVLGDGAHPDPAGVLEQAVRRATRSVEVVALVVGTDEDPQDASEVCARLAAAGARVFRDPERALRDTRGRFVSTPASSRVSPAATGLTADPLDTLFEAPPHEAASPTAARPVDPAVLAPPIRAVNVGLEAFHRSLLDQGAEAVQVDWRPPAGGDRRLMDILRKTKG